MKVPLSLPIEQKTYETEDYRAVVEGWNPNLIDMEVYRKWQYITNTETRLVKTKPRFGVGVQVGGGFNGQRATPYIGVGVQYNLFTF